MMHEHIYVQGLVFGFSVSIGLAVLSLLIDKGIDKLVHFFRKKDEYENFF